MTKLPPDHLSLAADLDGDQIIDRLAIHHSDPHAGPQSQRCDIPQPFGLALMNPVDLYGFTNRNVGKRGAGQLVDGPVG